MGADTPDLVALFDEIDKDRSGDLNRAELQVCVGTSTAPALQTFGIQQSQYAAFPVATNQARRLSAPEHLPRHPCDLLLLIEAGCTSVVSQAARSSHGCSLAPRRVTNLTCCCQRRKLCRTQFDLRMAL